MVPGSNPGAGAIFLPKFYLRQKNGSVKLDLRKWKHFRIFCVNKKRTKPGGWFDPEGEPEYFCKAESGRQYQVPEPFFCFISWHISCLAVVTLSVEYSRTLPHSLLGKTRPACHAAALRRRMLTLFRKIVLLHRLRFAEMKTFPHFLCQQKNGNERERTETNGNGR